MDEKGRIGDCEIDFSHLLCGVSSTPLGLDDRKWTLTVGIRAPTSLTHLIAELEPIIFLIVPT